MRDRLAAARSIVSSNVLIGVHVINVPIIAKIAQRHWQNPRTARTALESATGDWAPPCGIGSAAHTCRDAAASHRVARPCMFVQPEAGRRRRACAICHGAAPPSCSSLQVVADRFPYRHAPLARPDSRPRRSKRHVVFPAEAFSSWRGALARAEGGGVERSKRSARGSRPTQNTGGGALRCWPEVA